MLEGTKLVVLELDLSDNLTDQVMRDAEEMGVPVVGLPGNFECIRRRPELLGRLNTFVCNQYEAEELFGKPVASIPAAKQAAAFVAGLSHALATGARLQLEVQAASRVAA